MINIAVVSGRITQPIELKATPSGKSVCDFSLAVEEGYGENKQVTYLDFKAWNNKAELLNRLQVGTVVAVEGKNRVSSYTTKDNRKVKIKFIQVTDLHIMSKKSDFDSYNQSVPGYANNDYTDFEEIDDEDMPF